MRHFCWNRTFTHSQLDSRIMRFTGLFPFNAGKSVPFHAKCNENNILFKKKEIIFI